MNNIWETLKTYKNILILGFGKEGKSTYSFIRENDKDRLLFIADLKNEIKNNELIKGDSNLEFITGELYLDELSKYDCIIKTPGISLPEELIETLGDKLTSQADLFIKHYKNQIIGVTGTKGKSTTASFIHHFLQISSCDSVLIGNIGIPPFALINKIKINTIIVFEFSSHMLQKVSSSPHYAIFLNVFPEHLDYYKNFESYSDSKANIFKFQNKDDFLAVGEDVGAQKLVSKFGHQAKMIVSKNFSSFEDNRFIKSKQMMQNIILGGEMALLAGAKKDLFEKALETFENLPHRLQMIGIFRGITFVDDSISTIPESTLVALDAYPETNILILGGKDRGISYKNFSEELSKRADLKIFCLDEAGRKMYNLLIKNNPKNSNYFLFDNLEEIVKEAYKILKPTGGTVLLSPAASSYTQFKNFEERGEVFKNLVEKYGIK